MTVADGEAALYETGKEGVEIPERLRQEVLCEWDCPSSCRLSRASEDLTTCTISLVLLAASWRTGCKEDRPEAGSFFFFFWLGYEGGVNVQVTNIGDGRRAAK
jgi:hypothetical protein